MARTPRRKPRADQGGDWLCFHHYEGHARLYHRAGSGDWAIDAGDWMARQSETSEANPYQPLRTVQLGHWNLDYHRAWFAIALRV